MVTENKFKSNNLLTNRCFDHIKQLNINHPIKGRIKLNLWKHQFDVMDSLLSNNTIAVSTSRQMGMTTLMIAMAHWYATNYVNKTILYTSHNQTMLNVCRELFKEMDYNTKIIQNDYKKLVLTNGSIVLFESFNPKVSSSSYPLDMLLVDNAGFIKNVSDGWHNTVKEFNRNSFIMVNSTPNGEGNWFHKIMTGDNMYKKLHLPWSVHEERDQSWVERELLELPPDRIASDLYGKF